MASTKTHLAQIAGLELLALYLAQLRGTLYPLEIHALIDTLRDLPTVIERALAHEDEYIEAGRRFVDVRDFFFLGRGVGYPCDVSQRYVCTAVMDQNRASQLCSCNRLPLRLQHDSLVERIYETSAANPGSASRGGNYFLNAYSVLNEPLRVKLELNLPDLASIDLDSGNAAHRQ